MVSRAVNETTVLYKAIADFSDLKRKATAAKKDVGDLTKEYEKLNKEAGKKLPEPSTGSKTKVTQQKTAIQQLSQAYRSLTTAVNNSTTAISANKNVLTIAKYNTQTKSVQALADAYNDLGKKVRSSNTALNNQNKRLDESSDKMNDYADYVKMGREEQELLGVATEETTGFQRAFKKALGETNSSLTTNNRNLNTGTNRIDSYTKSTKRAHDSTVGFQQATDDSAVSLGFIQEMARDATERLKEYGTGLAPLTKKHVSTVTFKETYQTVGNKTKPVFEDNSVNVYGDMTNAIKMLRDEIEGLTEAEARQVVKTQLANDARARSTERMEQARKIIRAIRGETEALANTDDGSNRRIRDRLRENAALQASNKILDRLRGGLKKLARIRITFTPTLPFFAAILAVVGSAINPLIAGVGALSAGLFALASNLASVAGVAITAVPALFGLVGVIAALAIGFNGVGEALDAGLSGDVEKYEEALSKLSPSAQTATRALVDQASVWRDVRKAVQEALFAPMADDMSLLAKTAPTVQKFLEGIAGALGRVGSRGIQLAASTKWMMYMERIGENLVPVVESLGNGMLSVLDAMLGLGVAAGPTLKKMTKGFEDWAQGFSDTITTATANGSLQGYLDKVYGRLQQWGRIVGDIAMTLFNYGKAAEPFGQWMTDGLEDLTSGWKANSEAAAEGGSPFQKFLIRIRPLMTEINGLIGDFFGWLSQEMMQQENIDGMIDLVELVRDDLGPAVSDLLDTLADTDIDEAFIKALSAIIRFINSILENGGAEVLKDIATTIADIADALADFTEDNPGFASFVVQFGLLVGFIMAVAPLAGGLMTVFGALSKISKLASPKGWSTFFGGVAGMGKGAAGAGKHAGAAPAGGIGSWWSGLFGGGAKGAGKHAAPNGGLTGLIQGAGKGAAQGGKGGIIGLIAGLGLGGLAGVSGATNADQAEKNSKKGGDPNFQQSWWDKMLNGSTYVGDEDWYKEDTKDLDLKQKMEYDKGLAPGQTATKEGSIANLGGLLPKDTDWSNFGTDEAVFPEAATWLEEQETAIETFFTGIGESIGTWAGDIWTSITGPDSWLATTWEGFVTWFEGLPEDIATWAGDVWNGIQDVGTWISEQWTLFTDWFTGLPEDIATWAGDVWNNIQSAATWLGERLTELSDWVTDLPGKFGEWAGDVWNDIAGPDTWLGQRLADLQTWVQGLPGKFGEWAGNIWNNIQNAGTWLGQRLSEFRNWATSIPGQIGSWLSGIWRGIPGIWNRLSEIGSSVWSWARQIPHDVASAIGNLFKFVSGSFSMGFNVGGLVRTPSKSIGGPGRSGGGKRIGRNHGGPIQKRNRGGILHRANGGGRDTSSVVPGSGNVDKVPAMLTPGEFVIRKAITSRIGIDNLTKLNSGVISYGDMLRQLVSEKAVNSGSKAGLDFLTGGGMVGNFDNVGSTISSSIKNSTNSYRGASSNNASTVIEQLIIQNPVPETASDSLPKTLRRQGYTK